MEKKRFSIKDRLRSFRYAFRGMRLLLRNEHNARIHAGAAIGVITAGFIFRLSAGEWGIVAVLIAAVFMAEAFNSAVEYLADRLSPEFDPLIGKAKDVAAAGVLFMALGAAVVGLIIFVPKLLALC